MIYIAFGRPKNLNEVFHLSKLYDLGVLVITSLPTLLNALKSLGLLLTDLAHLFQHLSRSIFYCNILNLRHISIPFLILHAAKIHIIFSPTKYFEGNVALLHVAIRNINLHKSVINLSLWWSSLRSGKRISHNFP